jgi:hypothetical protein
MGSSITDPMKLNAKLILCAVLGCSALPLYGATSWWEQMDYGRFLSASFNTQSTKGPDGKMIPGKTTLAGDKAGSATNKGIAVKLGKEGDAAFLFDTELLRAAGGWTGGWVKLKGVVFDGAHGPNPAPPDSADIYFQTNPGPGWSKGDNLEDPRKLPTGPGAAKVPFGPLPREWAKYKGLYLHGDDVVFTYTVGEASLLEKPGIEKTGGATLLTRTFNVLSSGAASTLVIADGPSGSAAVMEGDKAVMPNNTANTDSRLVVGVIGAPPGARLEAAGNRITLKLPAFAPGQTFKVACASGSLEDVAMLGEAIQFASPPADLGALTHGGPAHWQETVKTKGELGKEEPGCAYVVDNLSAPLDNPFKSRIRVGGIDFFKDGRIAFSTWSGDVWIGKGIDGTLQNIEWKRYATGLFHALGLKIVDDEIYVLGRDQITHLHDLNGNGEADFYECFNNDVQVTPGFHEFTFGLETDSQGNFYFIKGGPVNPGGRGWGPLSDHNGCMFKVSKYGDHFEVFATGVRAPNGIGIGPNDEISTGDNQGTWVPVDYIHYVKQGEFIEVPDLSHRDPPPAKYSPHVCWVPYDWDNSNGSQIWVTSDKWGALKGQMLYLSYGKSCLFEVLQEKVGDVFQGGVVKFPLKFETGICRARFSPADGQLYVAGLKGWQTNGAKDGAIQRVRYLGKPVTMQNALHFTDKGIYIGFTNPVDPVTAADAGNYSIEQHNYRWTSAYGSADYKLSDPNAKGRDKVDIQSVRLSPDNKTVFLEVPGLQPVMQIRIKMNIKAADGSPLPKDVGGTINVVAPDANPGVTYTSLR